MWSSQTGRTRLVHSRSTIHVSLNFTMDTTAHTLKSWRASSESAGAGWRRGDHCHFKFKGVWKTNLSLGINSLNIQNVNNRKFLIITKFVKLDLDSWIALFVQKFNFDFPRKLSLFGWKTRENVVVLDFLAVDNFDFTRKIVKKIFSEKLVKMLGFCQNWISGQKFDFSNSVIDLEYYRDLCFSFH